METNIKKTSTCVKLSQNPENLISYFYAVKIWMYIYNILAK